MIKKLYVNHKIYLNNLYVWLVCYSIGHMYLKIIIFFFKALVEDLDKDTLWNVMAAIMDTYDFESSII